MTSEIIGDEVWVPIMGWEGLYEVSSSGRIRSVDRYILTSNGQKRRYKGRVLKPGVEGSGYLFVSLHKAGETQNVKVARMVATHFVPNPGNKEEVNHLDEDKHNNHYSNLAWCSRQENAEYSLSRVHHLVCPEGNVIEVKNLKKFARDMNLCSSALSRLTRGIMKSHKGYKLWDQS